MLATITSFAVSGLEAEPVTVEVDLSQGLPSLTIVGLPDKAVEEAKERVRSAIQNSGFRFPLKRITINLAPADLKKVGPAYDLPIALGILVADGQLKSPSVESAVVGELALDGKVRPVSGVIAFALSAQGKNITDLYVPAANGAEAAAVPLLSVWPVPSLAAVVRHLNREELLSMQIASPAIEAKLPGTIDFAEVKGQAQAKRALEIGAAGGHNILLSGPPGSGKTLLAKALGSILPPMSMKEQLEVTKIHSVAGVLPPGRGLIAHRPIRTPHHTASAIALIGGGTWPRPGEISLAHRGVLFLDELPEFPRSVLEVLRQPLEDGNITISRAQGSLNFPAKFLLIAAQNPCPCGRLGTMQCTCAPNHILRYQRRVSGPFLDRIDLHVTVPALEYQELAQKHNAESSAVVVARVARARQRQSERFKGGIESNAEMSNTHLKEHIVLDDDGNRILEQAVVHYQLSARVYHRILKVSRTIADLAESDTVTTQHIAEALQFRSKTQAES